MPKTGGRLPRRPGRDGNVIYRPYDRNARVFDVEKQRRVLRKIIFYLPVWRK